MSTSPSATTAGHSVTAHLDGTTVPSKDSLAKIRLSWGDHTSAVTVSKLSSKPTHRYSRPGHYTVTLTVTDKHGRKDSATDSEIITAPAGSYSGTTSQNLSGGVSFYVSESGSALQEISIPLVKLQCAPGGATPFDQLAINSVHIAANGSFSASTTQKGAFAGYPATFRYSFKGAFTGRGTDGAEVGSGSYRETIRYTDSARRTCTSNNATWSASREAQPKQTAARPGIGSYTGTNSQNLSGGVTFYVASNKKSLQQVSIPLVKLQCTPGGANQFDQLAIASTKLAANGSFTATATQKGAYAGYPATFTYTFGGNFHSVDANGASRAAGWYRETVKYTDTAARTCTSDNQTWLATRDAQPAQKSTRPPSGNYTGTNSQNLNGGVSFTVSGNRTALQQVSIPLTKLQCTPGATAMFDQLAISSIPLARNGSFAGTATQQGSVSGHPAKFSYRFSGNFHSVDANGVTRAAGSYRETITYTDTTLRTCTTDDQTWYATRSG